MIILVCKLFPKNERLEFESPEEAADFLTNFVPYDFVLEIDGNSYSWSQLRLAINDMPERHKEISIILEHLNWCLDLDEAFFKD